MRSLPSISLMQTKWQERTRALPPPVALLYRGAFCSYIYTHKLFTDLSSVNVCIYVFTLTGFIPVFIALSQQTVNVKARRALSFYSIWQFVELFARLEISLVHSKHKHVCGRVFVARLRMHHTCELDGKLFSLSLLLFRNLECISTTTMRKVENTVLQ